MITLKTLSWSNCFSYGENNSIDLSEQKITQILGTNGVGKSSIPLILEEVLFNKNSKGIKKADIANRIFNSGYSIKLEFTKNEDEYVIDLNRKSSLKVKLLKNGEDISSHTATNTYKTIEEIISIDFKTFSQIVYQNTNASLNFLTATDANRKKFLIDLLGLEKYVDIFEMFKAVSREVESEYSKIDGKVSTIEKWLEKNKLTDTTPRELKNLPKISEEDQNKISLLMAEIKNISISNRKISQNNQYKQMLKNIDINSAHAIQVAAAQSYDKLQSEVGSLNTQINLATANIRRIEQFGPTCSTCEQPIEASFKEAHLLENKENIKKWSEEKQEALDKISEIQKNNELFEKKQKTIKEWENLYSKIDQSLPAELLNEDSLESELKVLQQKVRTLQSEIALIEKENQAASAHNARVGVVAEQTSDFETQLSELLILFEETKSKKANLEILKKAFSTNGLIAYKIENLVKELEEVTGNYLAELSDGRFTLNFTISNDKLNVEITDNGNVVDILALSSGELARVNTATLLGIRSIMNSLSSTQINVLFLDEVINVLDDAGREKLVEVLLEEDLNTYIVSHEWSHPLLEKIEIRKIDEVSEII